MNPVYTRWAQEVLPLTDAAMDVAERLGGLVLPMWRELDEMRYLWTDAHALDGRKLEAFLGHVPHTPLRQALGETLASLGFRGREYERGAAERASFAAQPEAKG